MPSLHKIFLILPCLLVLILGGCSSVKLQDPFYSADEITRADLLSGRGLFGDGDGRVSLPDDHVMALDDTMWTYLAKNDTRSHGRSYQVRNLMRLMVDQENLGMVYDMSKTYTARDAFHNSRGNCLAFGFLYAAFGRAQGLDISFREVEVPPQWDKVEGELYFFSRHVNLKVHLGVNQYFIVDFDKLNYKPHYRSWKISDKKAFALYYSNIGTDYLLEEDFKNAFRYFAKALELWPQDSAIWSNIGVLFRKMDKYDYAEKAYFIAMEHNESQNSVFTNLSVLYDRMGQIKKAEYYFQVAQEHQKKNPFYRYHQALEAFQIGDYALTLDHLKAALKRDEDVYEFHALLVETYIKLGDQGRANKARAKAVKLLKPQ